VKIGIYNFRVPIFQPQKRCPKAAATATFAAAAAAAAAAVAAFAAMVMQSSA